MEYSRFGTSEGPHPSSKTPSKSSHPLSLSVFIREVGGNTPWLIGLRCHSAISDRADPNKQSVNRSPHEPIIMTTALWAPEEMGGISRVCLCLNEAHSQDSFQSHPCSNLVACRPQPPIPIPTSSGALGKRDALQTLPQYLALSRPTARPLVPFVLPPKPPREAGKGFLAPFCR